jgi:hypothetical protein
MSGVFAVININVTSLSASIHSLQLFRLQMPPICLVCTKCLPLSQWADRVYGQCPPPSPNLGLLGLSRVRVLLSLCTCVCLHPSTCPRSAQGRGYILPRECILSASLRVALLWLCNWHSRWDLTISRVLSHTACDPPGQPWEVRLFSYTLLEGRELTGSQ